MSELPENSENPQKAVAQPPLVRLSWRKEQVRWGPLTYRLSRKGVDWLAIVQESKVRGQWYWYGGGRNTCATPTDLETAKKDAKAHILSLANVDVDASPPLTPQDHD